MALGYKLRQKKKSPPSLPSLVLKEKKKGSAQTCTVHGTILFHYLGTRQYYLRAIVLLADI